MVLADDLAAHAKLLDQASRLNAYSFSAAKRVSWAVNFCTI
jgi:hypothetical protein